MRGQDLRAIPLDLMASPQWINWALEQRDGKTTKVPYIPGSKVHAISTDRKTWRDFDEAAKDRYGRGVGYVFAEDDPFTGVDLDHCRDPETGFVAEWAQDILTELDSYAEFSPSGTGIHIIVRAKLPTGRRQKAFGGFYDAGRYFTMTAEHVPKTPLQIMERQPQIDALHRRLLAEEEQGRAIAPTTIASSLTDSELVERARHAKNGARFVALWEGNAANYDDDESRADMALSCHLAFWCQNDTSRIDRLFRQSGLYRDKWDTRRGSSTYGAITIEKAIGLTREVYRPAMLPSRNGHAPDAPNEPPSGDESFHLTEQGNAERLIRLYGDRMRYCYPWGKWLVWDGHRWSLDKTGQAMRWAKDTVRSIYREAADEEDTAARKALAQLALKSETARMASVMLSLAESEPGSAILPDDFDRLVMLLNSLNATVDLEKGSALAHERLAFMTKLAPVEFEPAAQAPVWDAFLQRVVPDVEIRNFLQRAAGYSMTGIVSEQCLFFLYGRGANGKSTFLNTIAYVLGDYAITAPPGLLIAKQFESHPTDTASLFGARFVIVTEVEQGKRLAESLTKQLTGGDAITTRRMHEDFWQFKPTHHIWIGANHRPRITGTDAAIWRRIHLVPFNTVIPIDERDRDLPDRLKREASGILNWLVQGCLAWQKQGLGLPKAVESATDAYRQDQDVLGSFIDDRCVVGFVNDREFRVTRKAFYSAFQAWCEEAGEKSGKFMTFKEVAAQLVERGFDPKKFYGDDRAWGGLRLKTSDDLKAEAAADSAASDR